MVEWLKHQGDSTIFICCSELKKEEDNGGRCIAQPHLGAADHRTTNDEGSG